MKTSDLKIPRGIRNNNPLNIRKSLNNTWLGMTDNIQDSEFETFQNMIYGIRAAFIIIRKYIEKYKLDTAEKIIRRWAPPSENNTAKYIETVSIYSGVSPYEKLKFSDKQKICRVVRAMAVVECGVNYAGWLPLDKFVESYNRFFVHVRQ